MKSVIENKLNAEKKYFPPSLTEIKMDNEISLSLESDPPTPGSEGKNNIENKLSDPFKMA